MHKLSHIKAVILIVTAAFILLADYSSARAQNRIDVYELSGVINPSAASYLIEGIEESNSADVHLIVIVLDTPGGLDLSMRDIVKEIYKSKIPVTVFVSPGGARAASAGVFLTMASHVAAMAPGTNIGAAHPVNISGETPEDMRKKIENDAAAYLKSIAEDRGRNTKWAEEAVRESVSITESEALEQGVIDLVARDLDALLAEIDGREVTTAAGAVRLDTGNVAIARKTMGIRWRILHTISNPNIAYILMMLGVLGLFFELAHPGVILPGVVGAISLILGFYGLQSLPINYAGLLLIFLAIVLFIAEVKIVSYGFLTIGGIVSMFFGSLMLIDSPAPFLRISISVILMTITTAVLFFLLLAGAVVRVHRRRPTTGMEGLVTSVGEALTDLDPEGQIFIRGEIWEARCPAGARKGDRVRVVKADSLKLDVEPINKEELQ